MPTKSIDFTVLMGNWVPIFVKNPLNQTEKRLRNGKKNFTAK
jgi:hypothetical protein